MILHPHEEGREGYEGDLVFGVDDDIEFAAKPNSLW
jgi:hypothetical protein